MLSIKKSFLNYFFITLDLNFFENYTNHMLISQQTILYKSQAFSD